ncbi:MAG: glycogen synthase [Planctomycetes bacterium]|nr:glycogen synthase [Planctomycetota bacterium]
MKVAFVTPELDPLVPRTQLAEFSRALPKALCSVGADARVFTPRTQGLKVDGLTDLRHVGNVAVRDGESKTTFSVETANSNGLQVVLLGHPTYFANRNPYGNDEGPYTDNWRRYAGFSRAVLESLPLLGFEPDIIHCIDWTTGLLPLLRELEYAEAKPDHPAAAAGTFFQIHNLAMQGLFERQILTHVGIPLRLFQFHGGVELHGKVSFLKAGCEFATILGTHSTAHAQRIQQQDRGYGLESTFSKRAKELVGIPSGIDYQAWDPSNDPHLAEGYSLKDKLLAGKKKCKQALQTQLNLDKGPRTEIAAMIGRFDADSGFELLAEILTAVLERNIEVVLMGGGHPDIHARLRTIETTFVGRLRVIDGYNVPMAHLVMGGADTLLLPSHYHPGNALAAIAMRYGVLPVIYASSGLEDYVVDLGADPRAGTGFHFASFTSAGLLDGIDKTRTLYKDAELWRAAVLRCMKEDFSWQATAEEYLKAYRRVTRRTKPTKSSAR